MLGFLRYPDWLYPVIIPGLPFRWYGVMYLVAFLITYTLFKHEAGRRGLEAERDDVANLFFWGILGLLVGARLFFVLVYDTSGELIRRPWLIIWPFQDGRFTGIQGMSYHGGLIGGLVAIAIYARTRKINLVDWGDVLAVSAPLGYTFGRIGNFINGELYGRVTTVRWALIFPMARRYPAREEWVQNAAAEVGLSIGDPNQMINLPRHPSQLYEAFFEGIVTWAVLWLVFRRNQPFRGFMMAMYLISYGTARFISEYFRQPDEGIDFVTNLGATGAAPYAVSSITNLTSGQFLSLGMIVAGTVCFVVFRLLHRPSPTVETFESPGDVG